MSCGGLKPLVYTVHEMRCEKGHVQWIGGIGDHSVFCTECGANRISTGNMQTYPLTPDRDADSGMLFYRETPKVFGPNDVPEPPPATKIYTKEGVIELVELATKATYNQDPEKGGIKLDAGKPEWSMIPMEALEEVVHVFMKGRDKYTRNNWRKGMSWSRVMDSTMRHIYAWYWRKEDKDPESGFSHLAHAVANLMFLLTYEKSYKEGDDR